MEQLWLTRVLNALLGPAVVRVGETLGARFENPAAPIPNHVAYILFVTVFLVVFFWWLRRKLSMDRPGGMQHLVESVVGGIQGLSDAIIGPQGRKHLSFHVSLGTFIFFANLVGLVPGFESPTSNINVTAGCAIVVFCYYNWVGIRQHGLLGYLKEFMGPVPLIAPLMVPVEILSHLARPFSLSVRLFANIYGEDLIILVFAGLLPFVLPLPILALAIFTSLLQAFVFVILSIVYISQTVAHDDGHGEEAHAR
ncbi:MAG: F0F1 ATP synthase subunit A [Acidobacteria bacterium]|nr:F0F1 ATP synthase subunit A [Acidobacteriota bacterium]